MGKSCFITPAAKRADGTTGESNLFKELYRLTGNDRNKTIDLYFKIRDNKDKVSRKDYLDEFGEPIIEDIINKVDLIDNIDVGEFIRLENEKNGFTNKKGDKIKYLDTQENRDQLFNTANAFNDANILNDIFTADIVKNDDNTLSISLVQFDKKTIQDIKKIRILNAALKKTLNSVGVSIGCLNAADIHGSLYQTGITDFSKTKNIADGVSELIRVANGARGEMAIPEESSHVFIEMTKGYSLRDRLIALIKKNKLYNEVLKDNLELYKEKYNNNEDLLSEEAAGKILAEALNGHDLSAKQTKLITNRLITHLKEIFKGASNKDIDDALNEIDDISRTISDEILSGEIKDKINRECIDRSKVLYDLEQKAKEDASKANEEKEGLLDKLRDIEITRYKIYKSHASNKDFATNQNKFIEELKTLIDNKETFSGLNTYIEKESKIMADLYTRVNDIAKNKDMDLREKSIILRNIRDYFYSYKKANKLIFDNLENMSDLTQEQKDDITKKLDTMSSDSLLAAYERVSMSVFCEFADKYIGPEIRLLFRRKMGKEFNIKDMMQLADDDISLWDEWLDSASECGDFRVRLFDSMNKEAKQAARLDIVDLSHEVLAIGAKYKERGVKDYEFFFEKKDGHKTGNYIRKYDIDLYKQRRHDFFVSELSRLGVKYLDPTSETYKGLITKWVNANGEIGKMSDAYITNDYKNLSSEQKNMFNEMMDVKERLDAMIPEEYTRPWNAIKIMKTTLDAAKKNVLNIKDIAEAVSKEYISTCADDDIGVSTKAALKDFEDHQVQTLPVYYTKFRKNDNPDDISTDVISTMIAYGKMAITYDKMNGVVNQMELGRSVIRNSSTKVHSGIATLINKIPYTRVVTDENTGKKHMEKEDITGDVVNPYTSTNSSKRLDALFDMQVYEEYQKEHIINIGGVNIDLRKVGNKIGGLTAKSALGGNLLNDVTNIVTGLSVGHIEAMSGGFFKPGDLAAADRMFFSGLTGVAGDMGNPIKKSKLLLFDELFNVMQDYDTKYRDIKYEENSFYSKLFNKSIMFFGNESGEFWLQNRTALALANNLKLKDRSGNEISLWDALEVVPLDANHPNRGYSLKIKNGCKKLDGTEFTKADIAKFSRKSGHINQRMHGIYNKDDMNMIQRYTMGRLLMEFRKWIKPQINKKFAKGNISLETGEWEEGYYRTLGRFLGMVHHEEGGLMYALTTNWNKLDNQDKANIKRACWDLGIWGLSIGLGMLVSWLGSGYPPDKKPWALKKLEYFIYRFKSDTGMLQPNPFTAISEGMKILSDPLACIKTIQDIGHFYEFLMPGNYEFISGKRALVKEGIYKGYSKAEMYFIKMPFGPMPIYKSWVRSEHVDSLTRFFKQ